MMDLGKIKEIMMRELALFISISVVLVSCIISLAWYYVHKDASMKTNIDNAIAKGIDPIAVRCAYKSESDIVCSVYAATHGNTPTISSRKEK